MIRAVTTLAAACFALGCSTTPNATDIERTNGGVLLGIEACEAHMMLGLPLENAFSTVARGRNYEPYKNRIPGSAIVPIAWKLDGLVWAGRNEKGSCDVFSLSGSGTASRDAVMAKLLGSPERKWHRMKIIDPQPGDARDAACTTDGILGGSQAVVMTTTLNPGLTDRKFVATVLMEAEDCTSRIMQ